jgi:hypothetical protein
VTTHHIIAIFHEAHQIFFILTGNTSFALEMIFLIKCKLSMNFGFSVEITYPDKFAFSMLS